MSQAQLLLSVTQFLSIFLVTDVTDLFAFNLDVKFNPVVLGVSSVEPGSYLSSEGGATLGDLGLLSFDTSTPGEIQNINDSLLGPVSGVTGTGPIVSVDFDVISWYKQPIVSKC